MKSSLLNRVFDADAFEAQLQPLGALIQNHLENVLSEKKDHVLRWNPPEKELEFWRSFMNSGDTNDFFPEILKRTTHTHHPKYIGHQVGVTAPLTVLTGMLSNLLNNGMAVYEMGISPNAIERIIIERLGEKFRYGDKVGGF